MVACVGGGSNSIGLFHPFVEDKEVNMVGGVEPAGKGVDSGYHAASISKGEAGVIHGFKCYTLDEEKPIFIPSLQDWIIRGGGARTQLL